MKYLIVILFLMFFQCSTDDPVEDETESSLTILVNEQLWEPEVESIFYPNDGTTQQQYIFETSDSNLSYKLLWYITESDPVEKGDLLDGEYRPRSSADDKLTVYMYFYPRFGDLLLSNYSHDKNLDGEDVRSNVVVDITDFDPELKTISGNFNGIFYLQGEPATVQAESFPEIYKVEGDFKNYPYILPSSEE